MLLSSLTSFTSEDLFHIMGIQGAQPPPQKKKASLIKGVPYTIIPVVGGQQFRPTNSACLRWHWGGGPVQCPWIQSFRGLESSSAVLRSLEERDLVMDVYIYIMVN